MVQFSYSQSSLIMRKDHTDLRLFLLVWIYFSAENIQLPSKSQAVINTDISVSLPEGTYGRIAPRSGLAIKNSIAVLAGVIDQDYRGNIKVILFNHSESDFNVEKGQGIAQLIVEKIYTPELVELTELPETQRGARGFGSTEHYK